MRATTGSQCASVRPIYINRDPIAPPARNPPTLFFRRNIITATGGARMTAKLLTPGIDHVGLTVLDLNLTRDFFAQLSSCRSGMRPGLSVKFDELEA